jgi:hypothetical protein
VHAALSRHEDAIRHKRVEVGVACKAEPKNWMNDMAPVCAPRRPCRRALRRCRANTAQRKTVRTFESSPTSFSNTHRTRCGKDSVLNLPAAEPVEHVLRERHPAAVNREAEESPFRRAVEVQAARDAGRLAYQQAKIETEIGISRK